MLVIAFAGFNPAIAQPNGTAAEKASAAIAVPTGRIIIKYAREDHSVGLAALQGDTKRTDSLDREGFRSRRNLKLNRRISSSGELLAYKDSPAHATLQQRVTELAATTEIESASVEYRRFILAEPNDPLYRGNTSPGSQFYLYEGDYSLRAPGAWDFTTGSQNSVIAIIDTGILPEHPDLAGRSIGDYGYDFVSPDAADDFTSANDGDGRDPDPTDPGDQCGFDTSSWHGSGVASVIAGNSNNSEGIAGIDWNARLLHVRALGRCGGTDADIIDAVRWSAGLPVTGVPLNSTPATIVNLSIGGPTECTPAWQDVIDELNELNIPFVIAAGNEANNALRSSPANCANVITVGSSTPTGQIDRQFSNYGLKVTVAAPGRDIVMATNTGSPSADENGYTYKTETGSSFSAAIVSGAISLMHSINDQLSPQQVRNTLQNSGLPFATDGDCSLYYCGSGILNLSRVIATVSEGNVNGENTEKSFIDSQATPLALSQAVSGGLFGYRDIRYYRITTTQAGVLTVNSDSETDLYGYLLNDQLSVLALDDDTSSAFNFRVASNVPAGDYYLAVERSVHRLVDGEATFSITAEVNTDSPQPFTFTPAVNTPLTTLARSETVKINGLQGPAVIAITGGYYSLNNGELTAAQGTVSNGDSVYVSLQSSGSALSETTLQLTVGTYSTEFSAITDDGSQSGNSQLSNNRSGGCTLTGQANVKVMTAGIDPTLLILLLLAAAPLCRSRKL